MAPANTLILEYGHTNQAEVSSPAMLVPMIRGHLSSAISQQSWK